MNKQEYINQLSSALSSLSENERRDILRDVDEHFREGIAAGRTEDSVIQQLGDPKKFAEMMSAEVKIKRIQSASTMGQKLKAVLGATLAIIVLTPFNLIFVLLPLFLATTFVCASWGIMIALLMSVPIAIIAGICMMIKVGLRIFILLGILFFIIGWGGFVLASLIALYFVTLLFIKCVVGLFNWNLQFIKHSMR